MGRTAEQIGEQNDRKSKLKWLGTLMKCTEATKLSVHVRWVAANPPMAQRPAKSDGGRRDARELPEHNKLKPKLIYVVFVLK